MYVHYLFPRDPRASDESNLHSTGDPSSVICVEIQNDSAQASTAISCIGHVEVPLEALLDMCADGDCGFEYFYQNFVWSSLILNSRCSRAHAHGCGIGDGPYNSRAAQATR